MVRGYQTSKYDGMYKNILSENPRGNYGGQYQNKRSYVHKHHSKRSVDHKDSRGGRNASLSPDHKERPGSTIDNILGNATIVNERTVPTPNT